MRKQSMAFDLILMVTTIFFVPLWRMSCLTCDFYRCGALLIQTCGPRLVDAERLLIEIVAGGRIGTRTAAHADIAELAAAAFAFQIVDVAQLIEHDRVFPDVGE